MSTLPDYEALTLDIGGVFVVPRHEKLIRALEGAGLVVEPTRFWDGHHLAMHAVDAAQAPAETFDTYVPAFCHHIGLRDADFDAGVAALTPLFGPSALWTEPIPGSVDDLRALHDAGTPLAVVTNADGHADRVLRENGICQVGSGALVPVLAVVDSGAVGIAKPDPGIFRLALEALGTEPERTLHVGDSVHYDIRGAQAAGMAAVHFDPRRLCPLDDHPHVTRLHQLLA